MDIKAQLNQLQVKLNELIAKIDAWPQYMKIGVGMIVLGFILFIIGVLLY